MSRFQPTVAFMLFMLAAPSLLAAADAQKPTGATSAPQKQLYPCPMHPQIQWTRPDKCPICDMQLVAKGSAEKGAFEHAGMQMDHQDMQPGHAGMGSTMMGSGCSMCMEMMGMGRMNGHAMQAAPGGGIRQANVPVIPNARLVARMWLLSLGQGAFAPTADQQIV